MLGFVFHYPTNPNLKSKNKAVPLLGQKHTILSSVNTTTSFSRLEEKKTDKSYFLVPYLFE